MNTTRFGWDIKLLCATAAELRERGFRTTGIFVPDDHHKMSYFSTNAIMRDVSDAERDVREWLTNPWHPEAT